MIYELRTYSAEPRLVLYSLQRHACTPFDSRTPITPLSQIVLSPFGAPPVQPLRVDASTVIALQPHIPDACLVDTEVRTVLLIFSI
jgi:hypothetical protein